MSDNTSVGDRMKFYENTYSKVFFPYIPVLARLDGRSFHSFTKGLKKPYDEEFSELMIKTTQFLVEESNARCGYTQSDEISLVWLAEDWSSEIFFAAKLQKMNSVLASMCTAYFNKKLSEYLPKKSECMPLFDCRVFQVPTNFEAVNCFIWREMDATRNSLQMAARSLYSHNECHNKNSFDLHELLHKKGINWNDYPNYFKRGTYVRKKEIELAFTASELESLPLKHFARSNPNYKIKRSVVSRESFEPLKSISNREEVILYGMDPILKEPKNADNG